MKTHASRAFFAVMYMGAAALGLVASSCLDAGGSPKQAAGVTVDLELEGFPVEASGTDTNEDEDSGMGYGCSDTYYQDCMATYVECINSDGGVDCVGELCDCFDDHGCNLPENCQA